MFLESDKTNLYLHCLSFLQNGVDEHVQSLLIRLQLFNEIQVEKDE